MEERRQNDWREQALVIVRCSSWWACFLFGVATVLFLIRPAPYAYLLVMVALGVSYAMFLALVWRRGSTLLYFVLAGYISASATLTERLFRIETQYTDVQGVLIAFAFSGIYMTATRGRWIRILQPPEGQTDQAEQPGTGQPATRPVDEPECGDKPQPEAEGRSR